MLTYVLSVPVEQHDTFIENGWEFRSMDKERAGYTMLAKSVPSSGDEDGQVLHINSSSNLPSLQRALINRPLGKFKDARIFDSITLDHQGSTTSVSNALPASLKRMYHTRFAYDVFKAENLFIHKDTRSFALRLCTRMRGAELEKYVDSLIAVREGRIKLKRPSGFTQVDFPDSELPSSPDLWWDVENDVIFSFDKNYMARVLTHLEISYSIIDGTFSTGSIRRAD